MTSAAFDLRETYGAQYIGVLFAAFFQGMLTVQAFIYYESFPRDIKILKWLVAVVWSLDLIHLGVVASIPWHTLVINWGNPAVFTERESYELSMHIILVAAPTLLCQAFFLHRLWKLSHNWILIGIMTAGSVTVFALDFFLTVGTAIDPNPFGYKKDSGEIVSMFSIGAATDLCIALTLVYYLQTGKTAFDRTNFVITRMIQYTVATGLASSILAVGCVIANVLRPDAFIFMALHFSLGRMYTNALLATLNSRRNLRTAMGSGGNMESGQTTADPRGGVSVFVVSERHVGQSEQFALRENIPYKRDQALPL
ncbi:hypothetical protein DFH09DRAFT_1124292 [Mycena vulgaris]|nr:hypothetical protein DFH09DRAFT_1124292 [Mycena vulgaris]